MRRVKTKSPEITLLQDLLGQYVDQIERGINPTDAGWIEKLAPDPVFNELVKKGLCERNGDRVRVAFRPIPADISSEFDLNEKWLVDVHTETILATYLLDQTMKLYAVGAFCPALVFVGWTQMLKTSYFPVIIDRVLCENFSTDNWVTEARKFAPELSFLITKKWWNRNELETNFGTNKLNGAPFAENILDYRIPKELGNKDFERVTRVLKWDDVAESLEKKDVLSLGLLWFADQIIADLNYPESLTFIESKILATVEEIVERTGEEIGDGIVKAIARIERATGETDTAGKRFGIANWDNIVRLPW
jgi:hypothetical protein